MPGLTRGEPADRHIVIQPPAGNVRLQLALRASGDYRAFVAVLKHVNGNEAWRGEARIVRMPDRVAAELELEARLLEPDDYLVTLTGLNAAKSFETVDSDYFRVTK